MKKTVKKLTLCRETLRALETSALSEVGGGINITFTLRCAPATGGSRESTMPEVCTVSQLC